MSSNDQHAKRMANKLVKQYITSDVFDVIPVNSTNHDELEKLCLTDSKISDIECSFKMRENDYRSFIALLFETDKFIDKITDALAPSITQSLPKMFYLQRNKFTLLPLHLIVKKANGNLSEIILGTNI